MLGFDRGVMEWFCVEVGVVWRICCTGLGMRMVGCTYFEDEDLVADAEEAITEVEEL